MFKRHRYIATFLLAAVLAVQVLAALITSNPTANESPDATLGGLAVTTPTNTGHASTTSSAVDGAAQTKSCRQSAFQAVSGVKIAITLKIDHTSSGALSGAGASNLFRVQYTLNGGSNWTTAVREPTSRRRRGRRRSKWRYPPGRTSLRYRSAIC